MRLPLLLTNGEWAALLCAVTVAFYVSPLLLSPSTDWQFLFHCDDGTNFVANPMLQGDFLFSYENLYSMATVRKIGVYEPLSWLLKALIVQCAGLNSWAIRVVTLVLHFAAGCVMMRVSVLLIEINKLVSSKASHRPSAVLECASGAIQANTQVKQRETDEEEDPRQSKYVLGCTLSTLVYLVHPINVEVVGWASAQPYALAALFANLSLLYYVQKPRLYLKCKVSELDELSFLKRGPQKSDWFVAGFYLCSVLSKSVTVLLPVAFILVDMLVLLKLRSTDQLRLQPQDLLTCISTKARVLFIMFAFIGITVWSNVQGSVDVFSFSLLERTLKALMAPVRTMGHILWPTKLRVHYQIHEDSLNLLGNNPECLICIAALMLSLAAGVWIWKQHKAPEVLLATLYFVAMTLPTSGLVQHGVVSLGCDRYAYFPSAVLIPFGGYVLGMYLFDTDQANIKTSTISIAGDDQQSPHGYHKTLADAAADAKNHYKTSNSPRAHLRWGLFITTLWTSTWFSVVLTNTWRSEETLYSHSLRIDPSDWRVLTWRGVYHLSLQDVCSIDAKRCRLPWELAYMLAPDMTLKTKLIRSQILFVLEFRTEACHQYDMLIQSYPESQQLINNVGICRFRDGEFGKARELFARAASMSMYEGAQDLAAENLRRFDAWLAEFRDKIRDKNALTPEEVNKFVGTIMW